jgi:hypothetical protein
MVLSGKKCSGLRGLRPSCWRFLLSAETLALLGEWKPLESAEMEQGARANGSLCRLLGKKMVKLVRVPAGDAISQGQLSTCTEYARDERQAGDCQMEPHVVVCGVAALTRSGVTRLSLGCSHLVASRARVASRNCSNRHNYCMMLLPDRGSFLVAESELQCNGFFACGSPLATSDCFSFRLHVALAACRVPISNVFVAAPRIVEAEKLLCLHVRNVKCAARCSLASMWKFSHIALLWCTCFAKYSKAKPDSKDSILKIDEDEIFNERRRKRS